MDKYLLFTQRHRFKLLKLKLRNTSHNVYVQTGTYTDKHTQIHRLSLSFKVAPLSVCWCGIILFSWVPLQKMAHRSARLQSGQREKWCKSRMECKVVIQDIFCHHLLFDSTQRLVPYYMLHCVFLTSLTEINWVYTVGGQVNWKGNAHSCWKGNEWPLREESAQEYYCQTSQWSNWFSEKNNHI